MLHFILRLVLLLGLMSPSAFSQAIAEFDATSWSFGKIKEEAGKVRYKFTFKNSGTSKLILDAVKPSCGCTTADYSKDSIAPGGRGYVIIQYDPMHRPGKFDKSIVVSTNGKPAELILKISGEVLPRQKQPRDFYPFKEGSLRFKTNHLVFGKLYVDEIKSLSTIVYNENPRPITIDVDKTDASLAGHLRFKITKKTLAPGDTATITIVYYGKLKKDWGFCFDNAMLYTNDPDRPVKKLNVSAEVSERFDKAAAATAPHAKLAQTEWDFGALPATESPVHTFEVTNTGKSTLILRKVQTFCPCTPAEIITPEIAPGETGSFKVTFILSGREGEQEKELRLITNDPSAPSQSLTVKATVK